MNQRVQLEECEENFTEFMHWIILEDSLVVGQFSRTPPLSTAHSKLPSCGAVDVLHPHLGLQDFRMGVKKLLYLCGVEVLSSTDDHVFDAAFDAAITKPVQAGNVSMKEQQTSPDS